MRAVGLSDLDAATRAVLAVPRADWTSTAKQLIADAHVADIWRKRFGTAHPKGGTGSLYAQAMLGPTAALRPCSASYCAALGAVIQALEAWRGRWATAKDQET